MTQLVLGRVASNVDPSYVAAVQNAINIVNQNSSLLVGIGGQIQKQQLPINVINAPGSPIGGNYSYDGLQRSITLNSGQVGTDILQGVIGHELGHLNFPGLTNGTTQLDLPSYGKENLHNVLDIYPTFNNVTNFPTSDIQNELSFRQQTLALTQALGLQPDPKEISIINTLQSALAQQNATQSDQQNAATSEAGIKSTNATGAGLYDLATGNPAATSDGQSSLELAGEQSPSISGGLGSFTSGTAFNSDSTTFTSESGAFSSGDVESAGTPFQFGGIGTSFLGPSVPTFANPEFSPTSFNPSDVPPPFNPLVPIPGVFAPTDPNFTLPDIPAPDVPNFNFPDVPSPDTPTFTIPDIPAPVAPPVAVPDTPPPVAPPPDAPPVFVGGFDGGGSFGGGSYAPVVLDLAGKGIKITPLSSSNSFYNLSNDGYQHRTAWAGAGNAVLFIDPNNTGKITEANQVIFTDWDPTAKNDLQALEDVFDTNHDGKLDAGDAAFSEFKLMVTNADGTTTVETLAQAGITSIDLNANSVNQSFTDGSSIDGETTFTKSNGTTGTAATVAASSGLPSSPAITVSRPIRSRCAMSLGSASGRPRATTSFARPISWASRRASSRASRQSVLRPDHRGEARTDRRGGEPFRAAGAQGRRLCASLVLADRSGARLMSRANRDREFLPAALEILETPPSTARRAFLLTLCAFTVIALAWSYLGFIDIHAVAQGKIEPKGRVKVIEPLEPGKILKLNVRNGSHVASGDALVELDPVEARADETASAQAVAAGLAEIARRKAALRAVNLADLNVRPSPAIQWDDIF